MSADLSQLRIPTVPLPTAETQELHTHSHSKQTRSNQHLKPAGMSPVSIESRGLVKKADRYSEDETSPDSFTDEAAEQCHKKKEEKKTGWSVSGSFVLVVSLRKTHSRPGKCCKLCKLWLLMFQSNKPYYDLMSLIHTRERVARPSWWFRTPEKRRSAVSCD